MNRTKQENTPGLDSNGLNTPYLKAHSGGESVYINQTKQLAFTLSTLSQTVMECTLTQHEDFVFQ